MQIAGERWVCRGGRTDDSVQLCSEITPRGRQDDLGQTVEHKRS